VKEESINFKKQNVENRVHTIIEFIFKRSAGDFLRHVLKNKQWFDEIFILSGTTLEPRRKEIIDKLKSDSLRYKTVLLITTQVVEAGVDIDMDIGFKDSSLVDSDEQLAGRINRNVKKWNCKLFLFDYDDAKSIYGKDYRFKQLQDELQNNYFEILEMKNFDLLYNSVMDYKNKHNHQLDFDDNLPAYLKYMKNLNFSSVNSNFQLIENSHHTATLFAPLEIPIKISESENLNFNENELEFLKKKNVFNNADIFIDGEKVWKLYCDIIENKDEDFTKQRVDQIIIQGILAKFSFSISLNSKEMKMIKTSGNVEEQYGFYKLHNVNEIYDYETGIKELKFEDIHFW
jgi:CRISPR-associated endonuclease/helicase Cas3